MLASLTALRSRARRLAATAALLAAATLAGGACDRAGGGGAASRTIQVKGSDTMVNLGQAWAEAFMQSRPGVSVAVTGGGSGTGFAALLNGTCDVAQASRAVKPKEVAAAKARGIEIREHVVGIDALVVAVHPSNPVASLTIAQISDLFTGKVASWKEVGGPDLPVTIVSRERNSGTHVHFLEQVLRRGDEKGPEEFARSALMLPSSQSAVDEVGSNPGAIGYYGLGYLSPANKALAIAPSSGAPAVAPSVEAASSGRYPIARPLFLYTPGDPAGAVKELVDFCRSKEGQEVVARLGFVPLAPGK